MVTSDCDPAKVERLVRACAAAMAVEHPSMSEMLSVSFTLAQRLVQYAVSHAGADDEPRVRLILETAAADLWALARPKELRH